MFVNTNKGHHIVRAITLPTRSWQGKISVERAEYCKRITGSRQIEKTVYTDCENGRRYTLRFAPKLGAYITIRTK